MSKPKWIIERQKRGRCCCISPTGLSRTTGDCPIHNFQEITEWLNKKLPGWYALVTLNTLPLLVKEAIKKEK